MSLDIKEPEGYATKFNIGNKIASYIEAGIPCISYKNYEYMNRVMEKYGLSFTYETIRDIRNLNKTLKKYKHKEIEKKILKARKDFLMEKHFPRMERFVEEVVEVAKR